jgi:hypothetical protein
VGLDGDVGGLVDEFVELGLALKLDDRHDGRLVVFVVVVVGVWFVGEGFWWGRFCSLEGQ